ncbi:MAG: hypothetical protein ACP5D1_01735 [Bacteroidales bacterium]
MILWSLWIVVFAGCEKAYFGNPDSGESILFLGLEEMDTGADILCISGKDVLIAGSQRRAGSPASVLESNDLVITRVTPSGLVKWTRVMELGLDHRAVRVKSLSGGAAVVLGMVSDTNALGQIHQDITVSLINETGTLFWQKQIGGPGNQIGHDIEQTADRGFIIAGSNDANGMVMDGEGNRARDVWLLKLNALGDSLWSESLGYQGDDSANDVEELSDGSLLILGTTRQSLTGQADDNFFLVKTNSMGKGPVNRILGGMEKENGLEIIVVNDGFFLAGNITYNTHSSILLYRFGFDIYSTMIFQKEYAVGESSVMVSLKPYGEKLFLTGSSGNTGEENIFLMQLGKDGEKLRTWQWGTDSRQETLAMDLYSDSELFILFNNQFVNGSVLGLLTLLL